MMNPRPFALACVCLFAMTNASAFAQSTAANAEDTQPPRGMTKGGDRPRIPWEAIRRREDKNNDGKVTREEFAGPPPFFNRLDRNGDSVLTAEDFAEASAPPSSSPPATNDAGAKMVLKNAPNIKDFIIEGQRWTCVADGQPLSGILVKPAGKGPFPAILINHGMGSNADQFGMMKAREFVKWGMVCIATDLTHGRAGAGADRTMFGASAENLRRARACLAILKGLPEVDPERLCAYGNSMGAFLTVGLAGEFPEELAAAAITAGGVITQTGYPAPTVAVAEKIRAPFIILHGNPDTTVPTENSARLEGLLKQKRIPVERHVFDGIGHNLHAEKADEVFRLIRAWFVKHDVLKAG